MSFIKLILFIVAYMIIGAFFMMLVDSCIDDGKDRGWLIAVWPIIIVGCVIGLPFWGVMRLGEFLGTKIREKTDK